MVDAFDCFLQTEVERASETLLRLGILHEATFEQKTSLTGRICWLMFPHKLFQEYWAGYYASKRLCKARAKVTTVIISFQGADLESQKGDQQTQNLCRLLFPRGKHVMAH